MSSVEQVDAGEVEILLAIASESIHHGLSEGRALQLDLSDFPSSLTRPGASFVTLNLGGELRGCIGHLEARQPLVKDVAENAWLAAFRDPRFVPLTNSEFSQLKISISILSAPEPIEFSSESELLRMIRPGIDGLILREGRRQGTFLPSVWESLPNPRDFLEQLKLKAGLSTDYWSDDIEVSRYTTQSFS